MVDLNISVEEARDALGEDGIGMTDSEILDTISMLDLLAQESIKEARRRIRMKKDVKDLAEIIYSEYKADKRRRNN
jgi:hypothetical protein